MEWVIEAITDAATTFNWWLALVVLVAYLLVDAMYAYYTLSVAEYRAVHAATTGAFMHFLLALGVLSYVENFLYVVPIAIGSWFGTYYIVKQQKTKQNTAE